MTIVSLGRAPPCYTDTAERVYAGSTPSLTVTIYLQAALCHEQRETLTRSGLLGAALKHLLELSIAPADEPL